MQEFEGLKLSAAAIEQLYGHVLVVDPEGGTAVSQEKPAVKETAPAKPASPAPAAAPQQPSPATPVLGTGKSGIIVLVNEPLSPVVSDGQKELLQKMFGAAKQPFSDLAIINMAAPEKPGYEQILRDYRPAKILLFNISSKQLSLPFVIPQYKLYTHGAVQYLVLPALNNYLGDTQGVKEEKKQLWTALQDMFGLKG